MKQQSQAIQWIKQNHHQTATNRFVCEVNNGGGDMICHGLNAKHIRLLGTKPGIRKATTTDAKTSSAAMPAFIAEYELGYTPWLMQTSSG